MAGQGRLADTKHAEAARVIAPEPPQPAAWTIYKFAAKLQWLGVVEATDEAEAIEKAAAEFKIAPSRLMAKRRP